MNLPGAGWLQAGAEVFVDLLYPVVCAHCGRGGTEGLALCEFCQGEVRAVEEPYCQTCSQPFDGEIDGAFSCVNCREFSFAFDCAVVKHRSQGVVRELIHRFKYDGEYHLRRALFALLREALEDERIRRCPVDAFVPVPLHPRRLRERGFNQADALCQLLSAETSLPTQAALRRVRYTETQTHFAREERGKNMQRAFALGRGQNVAGRHLVVVDDVFTTGATVHECARVLRGAGAASVRVLAVARG